MRMTINGGKIFDLLDEGDFIAYEVEFEPGELTAHFTMMMEEPVYCF
jgi:hypothetical protein